MNQNYHNSNNQKNISSVGLNFKVFNGKNNQFFIEWIKDYDPVDNPLVRLRKI